MKRAIIVHCWDGYPEYCWYPDTKKKLEAEGFEVTVPAFPETDAPKLALWLPKLREVVGEPDEDTYLIGHSVGCITILRYLESLEDEQKIGGAVLVAGFTNDLDMEELSNFFLDPIEWDDIRYKANNFVVIQSDNDPYVPPKHGDVLEDKLNAELIIKENANHFSGPVDKEESCTQLPEVLASVLKLSA